MDEQIVDQARATLDGANAADPRPPMDGRPAALVHADGIDRWLARLRPEADPLLRIAARGQHLERWAIPRDSQPQDRAGYFRWRKAVHARQGERARELLDGLLETDAVERIARLVAKADEGADGQVLEDAACLTFIEQEMADFAAEHPDYDADRYRRILARTARKMSPPARRLAAGIQLPEPYATLLAEAFPDE